MRALLLTAGPNGTVTAKTIDDAGHASSLAAAIGCQWIDLVNLPGRLVLVVDDEGLLNRAPVNYRATGLRYLCGQIAPTPIVGDALLLAVDGENLASVPFDLEAGLLPLMTAVA